MRMIKYDTIRRNAWHQETIIEINITNLADIARCLLAMIICWVVVITGMIKLPIYFLNILWQWRNSLPDAKSKMWVNH